MKNIFLKVDVASDKVESNAAKLTKLIRDEFAAGAGNFKGYYFDFGDGETAEVKRWCGTAESLVYSLVSSLKSWELVRLFRNGNQYLAVQIVDLTRRSVREDLRGWFDGVQPL